jgi:bisanhydrobacterioruberin hydratase
MTGGKRILKSTEILLWVYGVGLAGMLLPFTRELFQIITPLNLLFAVVFLFYGKWPARKVIVTGMAIAVTSFLIEAAGVNTGRIFGAYTYGKALGPALWNTPVIIGLNWFLLIYCTNVISRQIWDFMAHRVTVRQTVLVRSAFIIITGSILMVLYDLFLEPAATRLDMWSWDGGSIPVRNYLAWFLFSAAFHTVVRVWGEEEINRKALPLFAVQVIFFAVIDLFYAVAA